MLPNVVLALVLFTISCLLSRWAKGLIIGFYQRRGRHQNLGVLLGRVVQALLILVNLLIALSIILPSFSARDLIQVLGISGVAIGFAFRDILQNFLAGILILLAEPFRVGEEIAIQGYEGIVEEIQTRATLIKTWDGFLVVIPNSVIYTEKLTVFNAYETRRTSVDFSIRFKEDLTKARQLIVSTIKAVDEVLNEPPPDAIAVGLSLNGVTISARWRTDAKTSDYMAIRDKVIDAVTNSLINGEIN